MGSVQLWYVGSSSCVVACFTIWIFLWERLPSLWLWTGQGLMKRAFVFSLKQSSLREWGLSVSCQLRVKEKLKLLICSWSAIKVTVWGEKKKKRSIGDGYKPSKTVCFWWVRLRRIKKSLALLRPYSKTHNPCFSHATLKSFDWRKKGVTDLRRHFCLLLAFGSVLSRGDLRIHV